MDPRPDGPSTEQTPVAPLGAPSAPTEQSASEDVAAAPESGTDGRADHTEPPAPIPHAGLKYLGLRTLLLLGVGAVLYLLGLRGLLLAVLAFLISGAISLFALSRTRIAAAGNLDHRISKVNRRIEARAAAEDVD